MGQMNAPLYELDRPGVQATVNSYKPGNGLVWPQLFPLKYTPKFDLKGIEGDEGIPVSADRVAFNAKAPIKSRKTVGSWSGRLGKIAVSRERDELEINEYNELQAVANANTEDAATARYLVDLVYNDVDFCNSAMDYRIELDALRIGSSGRQTHDKAIDGNNVTEDVINFNVPAENFIGAKNGVWTAEDTADGLKDIADAQEAIAKKGLRKPMYAIIEKSAFELLLKQKSTARRLFPRFDQALVTADMLNVTSINSYMAGKGWPQFLIIDSYASVQDDKGKETTHKPWNPNVVTLSPEPRLGYTYYKPVPTTDGTAAIQAQGKYYLLTRYSEVNPKKEVTMAEAYVQPALTNRRSLVFINVANATKFNEGAA